jgi:GDP-D-mannose dehydratase
MPVQDSRRPEELITGVIGPDGAYLAEYPLGLGCTEHGVKRRSFSPARIIFIRICIRETCR